MNTTALNEVRIGVTFGFHEGGLHSEGQAVFQNRYKTVSYSEGDDHNDETDNQAIRTLRA